MAHSASYRAGLKAREFEMLETNVVISIHVMEPCTNGMGLTDGSHPEDRWSHTIASTVISCDELWFVSDTTN